MLNIELNTDLRFDKSDKDLAHDKRIYNVLKSSKILKE
jgi:hypothetical protein